jgi:general stress protein CsbA
MSQKQLTYSLIVVGVVLVLASLLVDAVGIGTKGFGVAQIVGVILGIILAGAGVYRGYIRQKPNP